LHYPPEFQSRVRAEFPHDRRVAEWLATGSLALRAYLADSRRLTLSPAEIVTLFHAGDGAAVLAHAERALRRDTLYWELQDLPIRRRDQQPSDRLDCADSPG
jgi:hypothetical protein